MEKLTKNQRGTLIHTATNPPGAIAADARTVKALQRRGLADESQSSTFGDTVRLTPEGLATAAELLREEIADRRKAGLMVGSRERQLARLEDRLGS